MLRARSFTNDCSHYKEESPPGATCGSICQDTTSTHVPGTSRDHPTRLWNHGMSFNWRIADKSTAWPCAGPCRSSAAARAPRGQGLAVTLACFVRGGLAPANAARLSGGAAPIRRPARCVPTSRRGSRRAGPACRERGEPVSLPLRRCPPLLRRASAPRRIARHPFRQACHGCSEAKNHPLPPRHAAVA
jgi:hypothetical protein